MMTMRRILAILFLTYYLVGIKAVQNSESNFSSDDDETIEISDEDDTYSLEELTTVSNSINHIPLTLPVQQQQQQHLHEANPPIQKQIATVLEMITQTSSPLLMKLIAPSASDSTETAAVEIPTEKPFLLKDSSNDSSEMESETFIAKKPRLLVTKSSSAVDRIKSADSDISDNSMEDTTPIADIEVENNETNNDTVEDITTVTPAIQLTSKRPPKNIEIFKKRPNELLQVYIEDGHLRSPIAALVDKKTNPLNKAKKLWKAALRPNSLLDILVVSYDSEGIKSTYNLTNTKAMMSTLDKVKEENATDQESKTYYSIIRTGQLIPFDSAIFLSTDDLPNDTEHQLQASMFLLKKRIRLYLIIFDRQNLSASSETTHASIKDTGFLGQLAMLTGGDIIYVPNYAFQPDGDMGYITLVRRNKLKNIDQEPLREVHENELKNDTETLIAGSKEDHLHHSFESHEFTSNNN